MTTFFRASLVVFLLGHVVASVASLSLPVKAIRINELKQKDGQQRAPERRAVTETLLQNYQDLEYTVDITVGTITYNLILSTGTSDLIIEGSVPTAKDSNVPVAIDFLGGGEEYDGVLSFANVGFGGYTVSNQTFSHVLQDQDYPFQGIFGLGPSAGSVLWQTSQSPNVSLVPSTAGDSVLDRIFAQNTSMPNYVTLYLTRDDPSGIPYNTLGSSMLTIGQVIPNFPNITYMPHIPVLNGSVSGSPIAIDGILINSTQVVSFPSSVVPGAPAGKLVATLDTGFTFSQAPQSILDAIYTNISESASINIPGAGPVYTINCTQEINVTFIFGGQRYPIHPLDTNMDMSALASLGVAGNGLCVGTFQPIQAEVVAALNGTADMVLGVNFLRNTYTLFDYGTVTTSSPPSRQSAYVQLLSTTNATHAAGEFKSARQPLSTSTTSHPGMTMTQTIAVIVGTLVPACLILLVIAFIVRRNRHLSAPPKPPPVTRCAPVASNADEPAPPPYTPSPRDSIELSRYPERLRASGSGDPWNANDEPPPLSEADAAEPFLANKKEKMMGKRRAEDEEHDYALDEWRFRS